MEYYIHEDIIYRECNCTNWLNHWMRNTNSRVVPVCKVLGCGKSATVGGYIKGFNDQEAPLEVVPLCSAHNSTQSPKALQLKKGTKLVPVGKLKSCNL
jgi:hypothetical protein